VREESLELIYGTCFICVSDRKVDYAWWHTKGSIINGSHGLGVASCLIFTDVSHTTEDTPLRHAAFALQ